MSDAPYPYEIHSHRELELMLQGKKPLAVFAHARIDGHEKSDVLGGQDFTPHVENGTFTEEVRTYVYRRQDGAAFNVDYWFYTVAEEEWRVEAYCLLLDLLLRKGTWCSELEWMQGTLLGYTEEQNKYHLSRMFPEGDKHD